MSIRNELFRFRFKSGRTYQVVLVNYKDENKEKNPFGNAFKGNDRHSQDIIWEDLQLRIGVKPYIGFEIQRVE